MLAITRRNAIKEQLMERKSVTITDLANRLNVTKETIRRDLRLMEEQGELIRTHGGAYILDGVQNDIDISMRQVIKTEEKAIIAEKMQRAYSVRRFHLSRWLHHLLVCRQASGQAEPDGFDHVPANCHNFVHFSLHQSDCHWRYLFPQQHVLFGRQCLPGAAKLLC